ncbi:gliding motility-associated C-terminal domain-containing protein [Halosquirtibacter xylanolyticus]|uniref:gliding motility-associated C-terminal domain-containing protein n=1 Tax=Halosquirtibacter xylanolyticus TaxID=3374599 RepID=UPI0037490359|nr:gliding motility-associated C-terminal domain-containing protein [Prolixibacteraceae bacterium]
MRKLSLLLFLTLCVKTFCFAQLSSNNSSALVETTYPTTTRVDNIYFFNEVDGNFNYTYSGAISYEWFKWNGTTNNFESILLSGAGVSQLLNTTDGYYRVVASNATGMLQETYFWVFRVDATVKTEILDSDCSSFRLVSTLNGASHVEYFDPTTSVPVRKNSNPKYAWTLASKGISTQPYATIYDLPRVDSDYNLLYTDEFGRDINNSVKYEALLPDVKFSYTTNQDGEAEFMAPLVVAFVNESKNDDEIYAWTLYKSDEVLKNETANNLIAEYDSSMYRTESIAPKYTYETPGSYMIQLEAQRTRNGHLCKAVFRLDPHLKIVASTLKVPEAFSPNGDGLNDVLKIEAKSLKTLKFFIYNRWGRKIYSASLSNMAFEDYHVLEWDGTYNGKTLNSGVYFYTLEAVGRDDEPRVQQGTIHLFNN